MFCELPLELLQKIFRKLDNEELKALSLQSRHLRQSAQPLLFTKLQFTIPSKAQLPSFVSRLEAIQLAEYPLQAIRCISLTAPRRGFLDGKFSDVLLEGVKSFFDLVPSLVNLQDLSLTYVPLTHCSLSALSSVSALTTMRLESCLIESPLKTISSFRLTSLELAIVDTDIPTIDPQSGDWRSHLAYPYLFLSSSTTHLSLGLNIDFMEDADHKLTGDVWKSLPDLPGLKTLELWGYDILNLPDTMKIFDKFPNVSHLTSADYKDYNEDQFTVPSDALPNLQYYSGSYPTILHFTQGRPVAHVQIKEISQHLGGFFKTLKEQLRSIDVQASDTDLIVPKTFQGMDQCVNVRAVALQCLPTSTYDEHRAFLSTLTFPKNIELLQISAYIDYGEEDESEQGFDAFLASLAQYKSLVYVSIDIMDPDDIYLYTRRVNPQTNVAISEVLTIEQWRAKLIGPSGVRASWELFRGNED